MGMNVYQCIAAVSGEIAKDGVSKDRKNEQQGYRFRGIDDVLNALAPMLAKSGLVILPRCLNREVVERQARGGGALFNVTVEAEFDFVSAADSSKHTVKMYGEAMDSADKATNKAMSAAYKYAAIQTFCIPTEGENDADATTHEVIPQGARDGSCRQRQIQEPSVTEHVATPPGASFSPALPVPAIQPEERREKPSAPNGGGIGHLGTLIVKVDETTMKTGKPKWFIHTETGHKSSTIFANVASMAQQCMAGKIRVQLELESTKWGDNLKRIFQVSASEALPAPAHAEPGEPVDGDQIPF